MLWEQDVVLSYWVFVDWVEVFELVFGDGFGLWWLVDGVEFYEIVFEYWGVNGLSVEEIYQIGVLDVVCIEVEMDWIFKEQGL